MINITTDTRNLLHGHPIERMSVFYGYPKNFLSTPMCASQSEFKTEMTTRNKPLEPGGSP